MPDKKTLAEEVLRQLENDDPGRDEKVDPREVYRRLQDFTNEMAKENYFENLQFGDYSVGDHFIYTSSAVPVVEGSDGDPDYCVLPARYIELPGGDGIQTVYEAGNPMNEIIPIRRRELWYLKGSPARSLQGEQAGYPEDGKFYFLYYDANIQLEAVVFRLAVADSSKIAEEGVDWPIPPEYEGKLKTMCVEYFLGRKMTPTDRVPEGQNIPE